MTATERTQITGLLDKIEPAIPDTEAVALAACVLLRDTLREVHTAASHAGPKKRRNWRKKKAATAAAAPDAIPGDGLTT